MLSPSDWIVCMVVRVGDGSKDEINLVHELRPAEGKMQPRSRVEDDDSAIGIMGAWVGKRHPTDAMQRFGWLVRSGRKTRNRWLPKAVLLATGIFFAVGA
jgi:hypothetical protein